MPVVINEFEVLAERPAEARKAEPEAASKTSPSEPLDARVLRSAMRVLETQTLRI